MPTLDIVLIAVIILLFIPMYLLFILFGYIYCEQNNAWGILLFFISLNIIGLLIGCFILNKNNQDNKINYEFKKFQKLNKYFIDKNNIPPQSN